MLENGWKLKARCLQNNTKHKKQTKTQPKQNQNQVTQSLEVHVGSPVSF